MKLQELNPLRTLAGRLILVTIIAVAISHVVAFTLFANERGRSIRRNAETAVAERIVGMFDRMRGLDANQQVALATASSDFGLQFSIGHEPVSGFDGGDAGALARNVSEQLDGAAVHVKTRQSEIDWPPRVRFSYLGRNTYRIEPPPDGRGPPPGGPDDHRGRGRRHDHGPPHQEKRQVTEVLVDVALSPGRWLRTQAYLPTPRPIGPDIWFAALASMITVGLASALIARQMGKPLADLAAAAERFGLGETNVSAPVSGPEDVRRASTAFNAMAARLGRQMTRQRQMLWALSHDLRTPITALRLRAELVEDDAVRQRLISPLVEMETLTEQALSLARAGASEEQRTEVDLADMARTLCGELQDIGVNISADASKPVMAACRPSEIARAMRNLAENASKYGGGGVMKVFCENGAPVVEVTDDGPGLAPDILARVTEPFFRADTARSNANGAGLGLAIVQAIADGHGGRLVLENRAPHGLCAKLILPKH